MRHAFSILELIFVISITGIILGVGKFFYAKDGLMQGTNAILNDIRYTRNLALIQESFRIPSDSLSVATKDEWFKSKWQLYFIRSESATNNEQTYTIFLDKNGDGNANIGNSETNLNREIGVDILNPKKLMNSGQSGVIDADDERASERFNIERSYGIVSVALKGSCGAYGSTRIIFDEFGRLHRTLRSAETPYEKSLFADENDCIVKLTHKTQRSVCIVIESSSGHAYIPEFQSLNRQFITLDNKIQECSNL